MSLYPSLLSSDNIFWIKALKYVKNTDRILRSCVNYEGTCGKHRNLHVALIKGVDGC